MMERNIIDTRRDAAIGRTDDLSSVGKLLQTMGAPARNTRNRKNRREKFSRKIEHAVNKAAVKVDVRGNALVDSALLADYLWGKTLNQRIKLIFAIEAFFL